MTLRIGSLFSGVGGLEFGIERQTGGRVLWQVEKESYCRAVLAKHWPDAERFDDVCTVGAHDLTPVDILCLGFPCQDISQAGDGAGLDGARSGLWFEALRIIRAIRPRVVVIENVAALLARGMGTVLGGALPRAGMMRSGTVFRLQPSAPLTAETAPSSSPGWTTPTAADSRSRALFASGLPSLVGQVKAASWPTPMSSDGSGRGGNFPRGNPTLRAQANWPTPTAGLHNLSEQPQTFLASQERLRVKEINGNGMGTPTSRDYKDTGDLSKLNARPDRPPDLLPRLVQHVGTGTDPLNPDWVEILMGFRQGWTELSAELSPVSARNLASGRRVPAKRNTPGSRRARKPASETEPSD